MSVFRLARDILLIQLRALPDLRELCGQYQLYLQMIEKDNGEKFRM
jgi:hypothetical protein